MNQPLKVPVKLSNVAHKYEVTVGNDLIASCGEWAKNVLPAATSKILIVSNPKIFGLYGRSVADSLENAGYETAVFLMKDGERFKSMRSLEAVLSFAGENKISRTDAIIALGGGVVGDLAGFAAAVYLRGIPFLQVPTTVLSMIDSSVGGKTGVNTDFGKNLVGAFHQPHGVLVDVHTLRTLPAREVTAGICEAVKHGVISDRVLFDQTAAFLREFPLGKFRSNFASDVFVEKLEALLAAQVSFKARIVMNDEREAADRTDAKSRKILNFGHTLGHALEKVTNYKHFKHGEAVGIGILFAAELSKKLEILDQNELKSLNDVFHNIGNLPETKNIGIDSIVQAFSFDKKNIGSSLQWILIEGIGKPVIVPNSKVSFTILKSTLEKILKSEFT